eukprot:364861-Chlamydomonas_euryale.AAC.17
MLHERGRMHGLPTWLHASMPGWSHSSCHHACRMAKRTWHGMSGAVASMHVPEAWASGDEAAHLGMSPSPASQMQQGTTRCPSPAEGPAG